MHANVDVMRSHRKWTFSLKSLMFLTSIVAVCSALIGVSAVLAVLCLPLIAAALVRTVRASTRTGGGDQRRGLLATFCDSLVIVLCLIGASVTAFMAACCALALIVLCIAVRVCKPIAAVLSVGAKYLSQSMIQIWQYLKSPSFHAKSADAFDLVRAAAVTATVSRFSTCRALLRRWWYPEARRV